jgi:hypothetical protein
MARQVRPNNFMQADPASRVGLIQALGPTREAPVRGTCSRRGSTPTVAGVVGRARSYLGLLVLLALLGGVLSVTGCADRSSGAALRLSDVVGTYRVPEGSDEFFELVLSPDSQWHRSLHKQNGEVTPMNRGSFTLDGASIVLSLEGESLTSKGQFTGGVLVVKDPDGRQSRWTRQ